MNGSIFITRHEYDYLLLEHHGLWMEENWVRFKRAWGLGGVLVSAKPEDPDGAELLNELCEIVGHITEVLEMED